LTDLINTDRILINGNGQIEGLAIINRPANNRNIDNKNDNKNRNRNINSLQVVYIDITSSLVLKDLLSFAMNLKHSDGVFCDRIQVYIPQAPFISSAMDQVGLEVSEQFLLYKKEI